jgi:hypothetical protein
MVAEIDWKGPGPHRYRVVGHDEPAIDWFLSDQLVIVSFRVPPTS